MQTLPIKDDDESDESYYSGLESELDTSSNSGSGSTDDELIEEQDSDIEEVINAMHNIYCDFSVFTVIFQYLL